ncbi:unnamed protein product [Protopolystoma xenopodis]|uniref:Uncharacterized protein n=1 Tax=Protopolystoma xenopodis TaxID=117903 RepID=A0A448XLR2_9PLAT|nr:unnamed protein product [Protopolystoma xenopodis]
MCVLITCWSQKSDFAARLVVTRAFAVPWIMTVLTILEPVQKAPFATNICKRQF